MNLKRGTLNSLWPRSKNRKIENFLHINTFSSVSGLFKKFMLNIALSKANKGLGKRCEFVIAMGLFLIFHFLNCDVRRTVTDCNATQKICFIIASKIKAQIKES